MYTMCVIIKRGKVKEYTGGAGAPARARYNFDPRHPLAKTYIQCVRNRGKNEQFPVPRLTETPPRPPKHTSNNTSSAEHERFGEWYGLLLYPWKISEDETHGKASVSTWDELVDARV